MDGLDTGVLDAPEVDSPEVEVEQPEVESTDQSQPQRAEAETTEGTESPYTTKFSREYRTWLASQKGDPANARFVKQAKDDFGRVWELTKLEPKGIDGIREKYALLDSLVHGEAKGSDALSAMRQELDEWGQFDQGILNGDPSVFEGISPEFDAGLAKLVGPYLDRVSKSDPEAFQAAITPHIVSTIQQSAFLKQFNDLVDILNINEREDPRFDQATKMRMVLDRMGKMAASLNELGSKAAPAQAQPDTQRTQVDQQRQQFEKERQDFHWNSKIEPLVDKQRQTLFKQHFEPYQKRLKLNDKNVASVGQSFRQGIIDAARKDAAFQQQYKAFKAQKNPDPQQVSNYVNAWMTRNSKAILDGIVDERYGAFLAGKPKQAAPAAPKPNAARPAGDNWEVRTVKPAFNEINHQATGPKLLAERKYILNDGRKVQYRPA